MSRLPPVDADVLTIQQKKMYDEILRVRGQVRGPFAILLNSPELGQMALAMQDWFQKNSMLPARLVELAILTMARKANAQFAWSVHEKRGRNNGLSDDVIEALRQRRSPVFARDDERLTYDLACELFETRTLSPASYARGAAHFGPQGLVELVSLVGFYVMVAMLLNSFEADPPQGLMLLE
jgi:4-carboxymuconolactone decarboxylase